MKPGKAATRSRTYLRREFQYALDLAVLAGSFALSYLLRFDFEVPPEYLRLALVQLPLVVLFQFVVIASLGIYNFVWRYVGMAEIRTFIRGAAYSGALLLDRKSVV